MTRANARELAVHLIYGRVFTGEEPEQVVSTRLAKEYYEMLSEENEIYSERPSRAPLRYIDTVVYSYRTAYPLRFAWIYYGRYALSHDEQRLFSSKRYDNLYGHMHYDTRCVYAQRKHKTLDGGQGIQAFIRQKE